MTSQDLELLYSLFKAQKVIQIANPLSSSGGGTNSENNKNS